MISFRLAFREIKNNFKYWILFILNLSIGLFGFTFILLFRNNINQALELRSQTLLSSDLAITGRRSLEVNEKGNVDIYLKDKFKKRTSLIEVYSMGKGIPSAEGSDNEINKTRLVLIKAIEESYPLVGKITLLSGKDLTQNFESLLEEKPKTVITQEVAYQFKLSIGDQLKLGHQHFDVVDIIAEDSTSSMRGMNLAPKVYIGKNFLEKTGLVKFGSVAWYTDFYLFNTGASVENIQSDLQDKITDPAISVRTPKDSSEAIGRILNYLTDYLGLIGGVALLISSIGASYLFQNYLYQRLNQIGILKAIGLSRWQIILSFSWVIIFFGFLSSIFALLATQSVLPWALAFVKKWIVIDFNNQLPFDVVVAVFGVGMIVNLLIGYPLFLEIFKNKTVDLLAGQVLKQKSYSRYLSYLPSFLFLWGLGVWQAHSIKIGSLFTFSLFLVFGLVLFILPRFFSNLLNFYRGRLLSWPINLISGVATRSILRNSVSSVLTILSLSVGVTLLVVIGQIDASLKSQLTDSSTQKPSLFLFDIQDEQIEDLKIFARENDIPLLPPSPMIRARLLKKNGELVKRETSQDGFTTREKEADQRFNNRGVNLTYSMQLNGSETIVEGRAFQNRYSGTGDVEISLEKRYAQRIGVGVGDRITYDVLGVELTGVIVNLRTVKWTSFLPNFFILLQPGILEDAPKTYLTAIEKVSLDRQLEIQDKVVEKFSNISMVNVSEIITKILKLFKAMAWAINIMSLCCIIVGLFVLFSILQGQLVKKQRDMALQKVFGMGVIEIFGSIFFEYMLVAFLSLALGNFIGTGISYIVSYFLLDGIFAFNWSFFVLVNLSLLILTSIVIGVSFGVKYNKSVNNLLQS